MADKSLNYTDIPDIPSALTCIFPWLGCTWHNPQISLTHTHLSSSYKLTLWHLTLWTFQSLGLINHEPFFFFCTLTHTHKYHLSRHTHTDSWNVLKGLNVAGDWKVSQNDLSSSDLRDSKREKEAQGGRKKKEWGGFDSVCVWERERGFQLGTFSHYQDESENRKAGSNKQDERKASTVLLPVLEQGRKQQIF